MTTASKHDLKIVYVPIDSVHNAEYNPRIINESTKAPVRASIELHGVRDPLIVNSAPNRKGVLVGGNLRHAVMNGMTPIYCTSRRAL